MPVVLQSWLDALICFDYRCNNQFYYDPAAMKHQPLKLSVLLQRFEYHWPYYFGNSVTHVLLRVWMEENGVLYFINLAVCSVMFAVNVLTSVDASPGRDYSSTAPGAGFRIQMITPLYRAFSVIEEIAGALLFFLVFASPE